MKFVNISLCQMRKNVAFDDCTVSTPHNKMDDNRALKFVRLFEFWIVAVTTPDNIRI